MTTYVLLAGAIVSEVIATLSLHASEGLSKPGYLVAVVGGYLVAAPRSRSTPACHWRSPTASGPGSASPP